MNANSAGELIKQARQKQEQTLANVANQIHISVKYLRAIENMDKISLPAKVYTIGFVKMYVKYLGLDINIVQQFKETIFYKDNDNKLLLPQPMINSHLPSAKILVSSILLSLMILSLLYF